MRARSRSGSSTSSTSTKLLTLAGDPSAAARQRRRGRDAARDGAGESRARPRLAARSREGVSQAHARGAPGADAELRLARYFRGIGAPADHGHQRLGARLLQGVQSADRVDAARRHLRAYLRWQLVHANAVHPVEGVRRRELPLLQRDAAGRRRSSGRDGSAASATSTATSARRSARRS